MVAIQKRGVCACESHSQKSRTGLPMRAPMMNSKQKRVTGRDSEICRGQRGAWALPFGTPCPCLKGDANVSRSTRARLGILSHSKSHPTDWPNISERGGLKLQAALSIRTFVPPSTDQSPRGHCSALPSPELRRICDLNWHGNTQCSKWWLNPCVDWPSFVRKGETGGSWPTKLGISGTRPGFDLENHVS